MRRTHECRRCGEITFCLAETGPTYRCTRKELCDSCIVEGLLTKRILVTEYREEDWTTPRSATCGECGQERYDEEGNIDARVLEGMKCGHCAYGG